MSGHLKAVVFDWAGTIVDFGSRAPVIAFVEAFARFGVSIGEAEARAPMGLPKWDHVAALFAAPGIAARWQSARGRSASPHDMQALYEVFLPLNADSIEAHSALVPGAASVILALRSRGLKIGSTTGYTRKLMRTLLPLAASQGFAPDNLVCAGDLAKGRPTPLMMYKCFLDLGVYPASTVVKVDDTVPGLLEGAAAGTWTVGVLLSGNAAGQPAEELSRLDARDLGAVRAKAHGELGAAHPDYLIDTVADLLPVIDEIEARLERGERPTPREAISSLP